MSQQIEQTPQQKKIPLRRKLAYIAIIYAFFLLNLLGIEVVTRLTMQHVSSLDLFVATPQQKMQVADPKQATIFEGDPLLLWRLVSRAREWRCDRMARAYRNLGRL